MKICLILALLFSPLPSHARWAETKEAGYAITREEVHYKVETGGRYFVETLREVEILKDDARVSLGMTRLNFDATASELKLIEAYTLNGKEKTKVRAEHIEIKPLASSGPGFDEQRQLTIGYPDVKVGSKLFYRYTRKIEKPAIAGLFSAGFSVGWGELQRGLEITVDSAVPVFSEVHDPDSFFETKAGRDGKRYTLAISMKKPVYRTVMEEDDSHMDATALPWIAISTAGDWKTFPTETPEAYERIIAAGELPPLFEKIYEQAKAEKSEVDQINRTTSEIAKVMRYVGDWAPIEGLFHPRPLPLVAATAFGDCKDFSTVTATILRRLGFESHAAWTNRGFNRSEPPLSLPIANYNHAIVWARKNGREFWIDPTNTTSFAQGIYEDIAGREALVLDPTKLEIRQIPPASAKGSTIEVDSTTRFLPKKIMKVEGKLTLEGRSMLGMTGAGLRFEKSHLDYNLVSWLTDAGNLIDWKFPPFDFTSRIVRDFTTNFEYRKRWNPVQTSAGPGIAVPAPPYLAQFQFRRDSRVSGLYLPDPKNWKRSVRFLGKKALVKDQPSCRIRSAWLDFTRSFRLVNGALELSEEMEFKKSPIPIQEVRTPAFARLQDAVADCLQPAIVVFQ